MSESISVQRDVVFGRGDRSDLHCDVYRPDSDVANGLGIVFLHGGGFRGGNRQSLDQRVHGYVTRGFVAIASQYRLSDETRWPGPLHDVKACLRWTRSNAETLGIDPERLIIGGFSAGAVLALLAAGTNGQPEFEGDSGGAGSSSQVQACVAYYPIDALQPESDGSHPLLPDPLTREALDSASPITHVSPNFPPTLLLHGTADEVFEVQGSLRLFTAMLGSGVLVELHIFGGQPHIFDRNPDLSDECAEIAKRFLDRQLAGESET